MYKHIDISKESPESKLCYVDGAVASKPMTSVMGRIATDEPRRVWGKNKDLNNFGVSENTTGKGVSPDGSRGKTGGGTPSGGSGDGYEASYPAPSKNPMTSVVGVRQNLGYEDDTEGKETLHIRLFFTEIPLSDQWGDDWDDAPYEHNANDPYDDFWSNGKRVEHTIYVCNVIVNAFEQRHLIKLPSDYGYNSPFSVEDINNDAVAWMYRPYVTKNGFRKTIHAGASPKDVYDFLKDIFIECVKEEE